MFQFRKLKICKINFISIKFKYGLPKEQISFNNMQKNFNNKKQEFQKWKILNKMLKIIY